MDDVRIIAARDSAAPSDLPARMGCQSAIQLGPQAANTVLRRIAGEQPEPIDGGFFGQCISLGRRAGILQYASRDDTALRYYLGGRSAATIKELVCRSVAWLLAHEARKPGSFTWRVKDAKRRQLVRARRADAIQRPR